MAKKESSDETTEGMPAKDVDTYLAGLPREVKGTLVELRRAIKAAAPRAEEVISYRIPTYKYHGPLVHFVARKDYCSLVVVSKATVERFREDLKGYKVSGTTIHFSVDKPLPQELVERIVKARVEENEALVR